MQSLQTEPTYDKQITGEEIHQLMLSEGLGYLHAVTTWMEERSLPMSQYAKYIPEILIEQVKKEATEENMLKPSLTKFVEHSTLDFLYG